MVDYFWHITLPVLASSIAGFATLTLLTKNSFLDEVRKQYVLTARSKGLPENNITVRDRLDICKHHLQLLRQNKNENLALNLTKKHFSWYLKGFKNASSWRKKILFSNSLDEVLAILNSMKGN